MFVFTFLNLTRFLVTGARGPHDLIHLILISEPRACLQARLTPQKMSDSIAPAYIQEQLLYRS